MAPPRKCFMAGPTNASMAYRILIPRSILQRIKEYAKQAGSVEAGGFLMGREFGVDAFLVTLASTARAGRRNSLRLGSAPRGAIGWFRFHPRGNGGPTWTDRRTHARLFPQKSGLVAVLASNEVAFFVGRGNLLEAVSQIEHLDAIPERSQVLAMSD